MSWGVSQLVIGVFGNYVHILTGFCFVEKSNKEAEMVFNFNYLPGIEVC